MALIKCPECGKQVSSKAVSCPNCGYPISSRGMSGSVNERMTSKVVKIKMPNTPEIIGGLLGRMVSKNCRVESMEGYKQTLWCGQHGQTASFTISKSTKIRIFLGDQANSVIDIVKPGARYKLVKDHGLHTLATFRLAEVDVIDSDF